ncbi:glycosyltransferase family 34 protein [Dothistroma septosporum NZE10]|uniref:Glycosyltransferase family 34 protein n=1 Tax=Dothistroma septosporum (strain NZE10 / CBS 128990) TaxID=675120 RepID=M2Y2C1_DOTSN|nr:glycosyltransferase family 34 protein [Dothistroma septosporum NZE10]
MSSQDSPRVEAYADSSPTSPLKPLSPSTLPQWIRQTLPRNGVFSSARIRVSLVALGCMLLGWTLTSMLGPSESGLSGLETVYDAASGGVLDDPNGFGAASSYIKQQPGILGDSDPDDELENDMESGPQKEQTVSGALAELHHAVKGKIQSWNPYHAGPYDSIAEHASHNSTRYGKQKVANVTDSGLVGGETVHHGMSEEESLGARTRIGKCTILFNSNTYWERAIRSHERHDKQHGYRLHVLRQQLMDDVWSKPAYILSLLLRELAKPESDRLEWIFWVDADTIILNPYIPIEVFLPKPGSEFDDVHLMYSNDWNGLNNGVFPVRVNQWSAQLFSAITSFRHYRPEAPLVFRDQSAMDMLMKEPAFANNIVQSPQRWFNAYQGEHNETLAPFQIRRGDFLVHFAGVPNREERMNYWLERAEQHLDDWEIPVKSTSYLQEVRDFWSEQSAARKGRREAVAKVRLTSKELVTKIDQQLDDYGDRLLVTEKESIITTKEALNRLLEAPNPTNPYDTTLLSEATEKLTSATTPLQTAIEAAHKSLLTSAHEAIFAGEKDLLEGGFSAGIQNPEMTKINEAVKHLKLLVMMPQEEWSRHDVTAATEAVTQARVALKAKSEALIKEGEEKKAKAVGGGVVPTPMGGVVPTAAGDMIESVDTIWGITLTPAGLATVPTREAFVLSAGAEVLR